MGSAAPGSRSFSGNVHARASRTNLSSLMRGGGSKKRSREGALPFAKTKECELRKVIPGRGGGDKNKGLSLAVVRGKRKTP